MSKTLSASSPLRPNPQAPLELLSNTAVLKKVMDTKVSHWKQQQDQKMPSASLEGKAMEEPKKSTKKEGAVTPSKSSVAPAPSSTKPKVDVDEAPKSKETEKTLKKKIQGTTCNDDGPKMIVVEKSSSPPPAGTTGTSIATSYHGTPTTVSPNPPVMMDGRLAAFAAAAAGGPSSYGSLLLPSSTLHRHHQLLAYAAQQKVNNAMAACMMNAATNAAAGSSGMGGQQQQGRVVYGGGPSSAFRKPSFSTNNSNQDNKNLVVPRSVSHSSLTLEEKTSTSPMEEERDVSSPPSTAAYEALIQENLRLQKQVQQKDDLIASLQKKANGLEKQIGELRQLPTGKISHIPIEDMMRIMQEYGSEVSNQTLPKRKQPIQKASIVRQFRRWNPEFFRFFVHVNGEWVPRLGKEGELKRRAEKRIVVSKNKRVGSPDSTKSHF